MCIRLLLILTFVTALALHSEAKTNVLLITADDLGLQLSCYGDPYIQTPGLDALAASGVKFRTAYVTQASCSSSRSSMFTGLYPHTTGQIGLANGGFVLNPGQVGKNLPAYLKKVGYRTGILGKLHVSPETSFPFDFRPSKQDTRDVRDVAKNASEFFHQESDQPFFLMVNYSDPHVYKDGKSKTQNKSYFPAQWKGLPKDPIAEDTVPGWDFQGFDEPIARVRVSNFYNTVKRLDAGVGFLLDELSKAGHEDDTLVIFWATTVLPSTGAKPPATKRVSASPSSFVGLAYPNQALKARPWSQRRTSFPPSLMPPTPPPLTRCMEPHFARPSAPRIVRRVGEPIWSESSTTTATRASSRDAPSATTATS